MRCPQWTEFWLILEMTLQPTSNSQHNASLASSSITWVGWYNIKWVIGVTFEGTVVVLTCQCENHSYVPVISINCSEICETGIIFWRTVSFLWCSNLSFLPKIRPLNCGRWVRETRDQRDTTWKMRRDGSRTSLPSPLCRCVHRC